MRLCRVSRFWPQRLVPEAEQQLQRQLEERHPCLRVDLETSNVVVVGSAVGAMLLTRSTLGWLQAGDFVNISIVGETERSEALQGTRRTSATDFAREAIVSHRLHLCNFN